MLKEFFLTSGLKGVFLHPIWNLIVFKNTMFSYFVSFVTFLLLFLFLLIFKNIFFSKLKRFCEKTENVFDDRLVDYVEKIIFPVAYFFIFYMSVLQLELSTNFHKILKGFGVIFISIEVTRLIFVILRYFVIKKFYTREGAVNSQGIMTLIKIVLTAVCVTFVLDNLGFNISAVMAGIGVGGVAIALASQHILNDLFNYFVIFFDKPFAIGDFLIVGDFAGNVKHIGIKTTRITSLSGEELVFSNSDLTGARVKNYKKMEKRRINFEIGVTYQTENTKLEMIPEIIKSIIEEKDLTLFDRSHFKKFGAFSLDFETVYYVLSSDYKEYMNIQHSVNLKIKEVFEKENIEFAYPTQTLFVEKNN